MLNLISRPNLVSPVFNPILFKFSFSGYTIGTLFYLEIYREDGSLLTTLTKNGDGLGTATFDISYALQTLFTDVQALDPNIFVQKDSSAMKGYKVRAGTQRMVNNTAVKKAYYATDLMYAVRVALPMDGSVSFNDYIPSSIPPGKFLTDNRGIQPKGSNIYLPFIALGEIELDLMVKFGDVTMVYAFSVDAGLWVANLKPSLANTSSKEYSFWIEAVNDDRLYYSTKNYTKNCGTGTLPGRFIATASAQSKVSQADADAKATQAAVALANANLTCVTDPNYTPAPGGGGEQD